MDAQGIANIDIYLSFLNDDNMNLCRLSEVDYSQWPLAHSTHRRSIKCDVKLVP